MKVETTVVKSRGFAYWRQYEAINGRITLDEIADRTNIGLSTVRKFLAEPDCDVTGASLLSAGLLAQFLGTTWDGLLYLEERVPEGEQS